METRVYDRKLIDECQKRILTAIGTVLGETQLLSDTITDFVSLRSSLNQYIEQPVPFTVSTPIVPEEHKEWEGPEVQIRKEYTSAEVYDDIKHVYKETAAAIAHKLDILHESATVIQILLERELSHHTIRFRQ